jgi:hypothetical protein
MVWYLRMYFWGPWYYSRFRVGRQVLWFIWKARITLSASCMSLMQLRPQSPTVTLWWKLFEELIFTWTVSVSLMTFSLQIWCLDEGPYYAEVTAEDTHSPGKYRVIGSLSNSPEFSETWNCPVNSSMNPSDRCIIWWQPVSALNKTTGTNIKADLRASKIIIIIITTTTASP